MNGRTNLKLAARACALVALVALLVGASSATKDGLGPLMLDPQGADFTAWIDHFKNEIYKHWPPAKGAAVHPGAVVVEFTVARDGALGHVRLKKQGDKVLAKAAEAALRACALEPLPPDYRAKDITMSLVFSLGTKPSGARETHPPK
jgi:TonB family protein